MYTTAIVINSDERLLREARYGIESIPLPTPCPIIMLIASPKVSFASLLSFCIKLLRRYLLC